MPDDDDRLVPIGRVGRPHGVDGAFVVEGASDDAERWQIGSTILVDGEAATITLARRVGGRRLAIRLDRDVERGAALAVRLADLAAPAPDAYYAFQLIDLEVVEEGGRALGRVVDVLPGVANDNLQLADGTLVPLIEDAIASIDLDAGRAVVVRGFLA